MLKPATAKTIDLLSYLSIKEAVVYQKKVAVVNILCMMQYLTSITVREQASTFK